MGKRTKKTYAGTGSHNPIKALEKRKAIYWGWLSAHPYLPAPAVPQPTPCSPSTWGQPTAAHQGQGGYSRISIPSTKQILVSNTTGSVIPGIP